VIGDVSGRASCGDLHGGKPDAAEAIATQVVNPGRRLPINAMLIPEGNGKMFVTIFYGVLNTRTGEMQFSYGGQPPPYIKRSSGAVEKVAQEGGFLLGMVAGMEYDNHKIVLRPGDTILLYTDGVTEAMDNNEQLLTTSGRAARPRKRAGSGAIARDPWSWCGLPERAAGDIMMLALQYRGRVSELIVDSEPGHPSRWRTGAAGVNGIHVEGGAEFAYLHRRLCNVVESPSRSLRFTNPDERSIESAGGPRRGSCCALRKREGGRTLRRTARTLPLLRNLC
jgi:sigma-B regulation protein RsbU (phosphoserine phosphatase)